MGKLVFGFVLLAIAFFLRLGAATVGTQGSSGRPVGGVLRGLSYVALVLGVVIALGSALVVVNPGEVGVRDAMVQYSINDIAKRTQIATTMEKLVDSALVTQPRAGGPPFRIATVTAFFLRDLQPPAQVVQAINNKIAQEQRVETERHRVEVARLQAEQQRLLNTTLTPEALTRQYFDVLRELKSSNNLVILVPTSGGIPMLNIGDLRRNLRQP